MRGYGKCALIVDGKALGVYFSAYPFDVVGSCSVVDGSYSIGMGFGKEIQIAVQFSKISVPVVDMWQ